MAAGLKRIVATIGRDRHSGVEVASSGDIVFESGGRLARFTSARAVEMALPRVSGEFAGRVAEASPGDWLVAFRPDARQPFGIYRWRPGQGVPAKIAGGRMASAGAAGAGSGRTRFRSGIPSGLGDREGANLLCLNAYTSRSRIAAGYGGDGSGVGAG